MRKVIGIGETVLDIIFRDCQPIGAVPGGSVFNALISLGRSGIKASFISETGNDRVGQGIIGFLKEKNWRDFSWEMNSCTVNLWLPRFETKYNKKLNDILSEMGMPSSFDEARADFKAMSDFAGYLSYVRQDAIIKVDEEGTEAAVVSHAGMVKDTAMPSQYAVFHADHPFLYLITENSSSAILFAGKYSGK